MKWGGGCGVGGGEQCFLEVSVMSSRIFPRRTFKLNSFRDFKLFLAFIFNKISLWSSVFKISESHHQET